MSNTVPVFLTFDDNWTDPAIVAITSILSNTCSPESIRFYVINGGLPRRSRNRIGKQAAKYSSTPITFVNYKNEDYPITYRADSGYSLDTYTRLFIPEIITSESAGIYIDVDVVVMTDLVALWNRVNIDGYYLAVVKDIYTNTLIFQDEHPNFDKRYFGKYFYAGFSIMNLDAIRSANLTERFADEARNAFVFHDQDIFNIGCFGKVKYLHQKYQVLSGAITTYPKATLRSMGILDEYMEALEDMRIIHYAGGSKPWKRRNNNMVNCLWWRYYNRSILSKELKTIKTRLKFHKYYRRKLKKLLKACFS